MVILFFSNHYSTGSRGSPHLPTPYYRSRPLCPAHRWPMLGQIILRLATTQLQIATDRMQRDAQAFIRTQRQRRCWRLCSRARTKSITNTNTTFPRRRQQAIPPSLMLVLLLTFVMLNRGKVGVVPASAAATGKTDKRRTRISLRDQPHRQQLAVTACARRLNQPSRIWRQRKTTHQHQLRLSKAADVQSRPPTTIATRRLVHSRMTRMKETTTTTTTTTESTAIVKMSAMAR